MFVIAFRQMSRKMCDIWRDQASEMEFPFSQRFPAEQIVAKKAVYADLIFKKEDVIRRCIGGHGEHFSIGHGDAGS